MEVPSMKEFIDLKKEVEQLKKLVMQLHENKVSVEWVRADVACTIIDVSRTTLWRLTKDREITYEKRGRTIRYGLESLRAYLVKHRHDPAVIETRVNSIFKA